MNQHPPRRAHNKSRAGCSQCKKRRVKCDEKGPPCGPCSNRELGCEYLHGSQRARITPAGVSSLVSVDGPTPPSDQQEQPTLDFPSKPVSTNLIELELMHQWSTVTYKSFCATSVGEYHTWQVILPREGLKYHFLLHGMFSFAALEIGVTGDHPNRQDYINMALEYYDAASSSFRAELGNITPDKQQAVLAFSLIAMTLSLALPQFTKTNGEPHSIVDNMLVHFELLTGAGSIVHQCRDELLERPILQNQKHFNDIPMGSLEPETEAALLRLHEFNDARHGRDPTQSPRERIQAITYHSACHKAILFLEESFGWCKDPANRGYCLAWIGQAGKEFIAALQNQDPVALLALMHWGVLAQRCSEGIWWAEFLGRNLVIEISDNFYKDSDQSLRENITWVRTQVGL